MAFDSTPLRVEVVSADGLIWEGDAVQVIARTTEGDIGILSHHEPFFGVLVPSAVEVITDDGNREIIAVDGGFVSVAENRVSLLNAYARLAREIDQAAAEHQLNEAQLALEKGDVSTETMQTYHRASAQVRAAAKAVGRR